MTTSKSKLIAFHGSKETKEFYVSRVLGHMKADEIISGTGWENGKGCAVGCSMHNYRHQAYEDEIGHPAILARLEDQLFEMMHKFDPETAKAWPLRYMSAATEGADLNFIWAEWCLWVLVDPETGVIRHAKTDQSKAASNGVADLYREWVQSGT